MTNFEVQVRDESVWLRFVAPSGKEALVSVNWIARNCGCQGSIIKTALLEWQKAKIEEAKGYRNEHLRSESIQPEQTGS